MVRSCWIESERKIGLSTLLCKWSSKRRSNQSVHYTSSDSFLFYDKLKRDKLNIRICPTWTSILLGRTIKPRSRDDDGTNAQKGMLPGISRERKLRSKTWWFTEFCNSHYVSHFAAFFIVARAKISVAKSCFMYHWLLSLINKYQSIACLLWFVWGKNKRVIKRRKWGFFFFPSKGKAKEKS